VATKTKKAASGETPRWHYVIGALVAVCGLLWAIASTFIKKESPPAPTGVQQSAVGIGGNAINAVGNAGVTIGPGGPTAQGANSASAPVTAASQTAQAGGGGTAVNATDAAQVRVVKP
jgi:drug/metabolite transporter (DMT)-like permease